MGPQRQTERVRRTDPALQSEEVQEQAAAGEVQNRNARNIVASVSVNQSILCYYISGNRRQDSHVPYCLALLALTISFMRRAEGTSFFLDS